MILPIDGPRSKIFIDFFCVSNFCVRFGFSKEFQFGFCNKKKENNFSINIMSSIICPD